MAIKRVAITGGARGIGRATAQACLSAGMSVVIGDVDGAACAAVASELGDRAVGLPLDVRDADGFEAFLTAAENRLGPLDALVNNAGIARSAYSSTKTRPTLNGCSTSTSAACSPAPGWLCDGSCPAGAATS